MATQVLHRTFTADEFHQMICTGVLSEDEGVELLEGSLIVMSPIGSYHAGSVKRLNQLFSNRLGMSVIVSVQDPIHLGEYSEPQPDVALLKFRPDFYAQAHPTANDVLLVVEVMETSADYDRDFKLPLYARAGIPDLWLVDLGEEWIEIYRQPTEAGYQEACLVRRGQYLSPAAFQGIELAVDDILG